MNAITITNLKKQVEEFQLGPINMDIQSETITALVGNNGSGKSTLLKMMMNLVKQDEGNIKVFNTLNNGDNEDWKQHIAYQPQVTIGYDPFTGEALRELISQWYPTWDEAFFQEIIKTFDISLTKKYGKLSPGAQQKLSFALTIARNAPILILDEPTAHIDIPSKKVMIDLLTEWMDEGNRTMIIASHQIDDIRKLSDFLYVIQDGSEVGQFEKESLIENYIRYWLPTSLPSSNIPGEVSREGQTIISNDAKVTESFFNEKEIHWTDRTSADLEDIITILLAKDDY